MWMFLVGQARGGFSGRVVTSSLEWRAGCQRVSGLDDVEGIYSCTGNLTQGGYPLVIVVLLLTLPPLGGGFILDESALRVTSASALLAFSFFFPSGNPS